MLEATSHGLVGPSDGSTRRLIRAIIPDLPSEFVARLQGVTEAPGLPPMTLELLVARTPEEATELLRTQDEISVLIDAVEMGAPTRW